MCHFKTQAKATASLLLVAFLLQPAPARADDRGEYDKDPSKRQSVDLMIMAGTGATAVLGTVGSIVNENKSMENSEALKKLLREMEAQKELENRHLNPGNGTFKKVPQTVWDKVSQEKELNRLRDKMHGLKGAQFFYLTTVGASLWGVALSGFDAVSIPDANSSSKVPPMRSVVTNRETPQKTLPPDESGPRLEGESHQDHPNGVGAE